MPPNPPDIHQNLNDEGEELINSKSQKCAMAVAPCLSQKKQNKKKDFGSRLNFPFSFWALTAVYRCDGWDGPTQRDSPSVLVQEGMLHRSISNYKLDVFPLNF